MRVYFPRQHGGKAPCLRSTYRGGRWWQATAVALTLALSSHWGQSQTQSNPLFPVCFPSAASAPSTSFFPLLPVRCSSAPTQSGFSPRHGVQGNCPLPGLSTVLRLRQGQQAQCFHVLCSRRKQSPSSI